MTMNGTRGNCRDCGRETDHLRCRACNAINQKLVAAQEMDDLDQEMLRWVDVDHLTQNAVAVRLGTSRQAIGRRIRAARVRQAFLRDYVPSAARS